MRRKRDLSAGPMVVTEGSAKLASSHSGGKEATLRMLGPWDVFGDVAPGAHADRRTRAEALTTCEVKGP
jgi:CRP-like cAMP-binding protein